MKRMSDPSHGHGEDVVLTPRIGQLFAHMRYRACDDIRGLRISGWLVCAFVPKRLKPWPHLRSFALLLRVSACIDRASITTS